MTAKINITKINFQTGQASTSEFTKSELFSWYNRARAAARQGKIEAKRVNRALGYLQSGQAQTKWAEYHTTTTFCGCPDHARGHTCKHQIALMIVKRIEQNQPVGA